MGVNEPSLDEFLELISKRRCRYTLYCLDEVDEKVIDLDDLAGRVAQREREWDAPECTTAPSHRENVAIALHHNHLPRLADAGLIDYDARTTTVRNWDDPSIVEWVQSDVNELRHLRALLTNSKV